MVDLAIERVKLDDTKRRAEVVALKQQIIGAKSFHEENTRRRRLRTTYHAGKLPVEIFAEIFQLLVAIDVTHAIVVSHVCRQWRAVALNTPSLWRTLILAKKNPASKTKEWNKRSRGHIHELHLKSRLKDSGVSLIDAVRGFPWDGLRIYRNDRNPIFSIHQVLPEQSASNVLANLVELETAGHPDEASRLFPYQIPPSSGLRSLTIKNQVFYWGHIYPHVTELKTLVITQCVVEPGSIQIPRVLDLLAANPSLEKVIIGFTSRSSASISASPMTPFNLTHLVHLEVIGMPAKSFIGITMPSLQILRLTRLIGGADELLISLNTRLPSLKELSFNSSAVTSSTLIPFLQATPMLEVFELSSIMGCVNDIVEALALPAASVVHSPNTSLLCPSLTQIKLSRCAELRTGGVMRLVKSRLPLPEMPALDQDANDTGLCPAAQIQSLVLDGCPNIELEALPWLRSKIQSVSCLYASGKEARWKR